jgi:hypothetical protein
VQAVLTMNGLQMYPGNLTTELAGLPNYVTEDVLAHEFGHEWLAYCFVQAPGAAPAALLGRALQHWSFFFDADGSVMEGPDWVRQGPDTFSSLPPIARYGPLDQYLMGLRGPDEVDSLVVLSDTATFYPPDPLGPKVPYSDPNKNLTAHGPWQEFAIGDVEAANGPRVPGVASAPHALRVAFALVVPRGSDATAADLAKVNMIRTAFPDTVQSYTGGRMSVDVSLDSHAGSLRLDHVPLGDIESSSVPRTVTVHVNVVPAACRRTWIPRARPCRGACCPTPPGPRCRWRPRRAIRSRPRSRPRRAGRRSSTASTPRLTSPASRRTCPRRRACRSPTTPGRISSRR